MERRVTPSSLSAVSRSYLRSITACFLTLLEPNTRGVSPVCKQILPSGHLQLAHPVGTEGAWSSCATNLSVWQLRHGQLQEEQPWNGMSSME